MLYDCSVLSSEKKESLARSDLAISLFLKITRLISG